MFEDSGELDYLARAQPELDPQSFEEVVKEAFLLEHGCKKGFEIAAILGLDKSRVSQILRKPEILKLDSIQNLLDCLSGSEHRRRIVRAWAEACFGEDIEVRTRRPLTGATVNEKTLRRVDRQLREGRLATAAQIALEALAKTTNYSLRQQFLDRACFAHQRLDEPGQAMRVARLIVDDGMRSGDRAREAAGHLLQARILLGMGDCRPEHLPPMFEQIAGLLNHSGESAAESPYLVCRPAMLEGLQLSARLTFMRLGSLAWDEVFLREQVARLSASLREKQSFHGRFLDHLQLATVHLMLGETVAAEENLDAAYRSGMIKNLQVYEMCGLIKGRILAKTQPPEVASRHLIAVSRNCRNSLDAYHKRIAELELARLELARTDPGRRTRDEAGR